MSNGTKGFGSKVIGHEAAAEAIRNEQGGGEVFGTRVRGAITGSGPTNDAKRVSEFGAAVIEGAHASNAQGEKGDTVSVEELRNILAENPTFFDSLYEAELAREDGPREDALGIFYEVERGIKGQMRADVMAEIRALLGEKNPEAAAQAAAVKVHAKLAEGMQKRTEENRLLDDAARVRSLRQRNEDIAEVKRAQDEGTTSVQISSSTEAQARSIAEDEGIDLTGGAGQTGSSGATGTPAKPDGDVHPETQSPGNRLGVPKGDSTTSSTGSSGSTTSPAAGASDEKGARKAKAEKFTAEAREYPKDKLDSDLRKALGDEKVDAIEGSGANGNVVKEDLVTFAATAIEEGTVDTNRSGYIVASS